MSLLGRLEDLSLTDIIQIVFLSRRTGILEIVDDRGRHTVMFRQGVIVNASSPELPDLVAFFAAENLIAPENVKVLRQMEDSGIPFGTAALEMNLLSNQDLGNAIKRRITSVVTPLLQSKEGEFNFILSENMTALDVEYEADSVFKEGGLPPHKIIATGEGEKLKPLKGLEDSLRAGKALLRGTTPVTDSSPVGLNLGLGSAASDEATADDNVLPFPSREDDEPFGDAAPFEEPAAFAPLDDASPFPESGDPFPSTPEPAKVAHQDHAPVPAAHHELAPLPAPPASITTPQSPAHNFKIAGGLIGVESPDAAYRNVVLFERNPMVRVAARRAFGKKNVKIFQFGALEDVRAAMTDLFRSNSYFVTFLELTPDDASVKLMHQMKRRNPRLPVVLVDNEADLRRRHDLLRAGADLYVTKPSPARLQPGLVEEELSLFADELVLFAERSFAQWEQVTGGGVEAGRKFYEMADKENLDRSFGVLKQLINELSNPNDISQVAATILRMSGEYLDRGALFMFSNGEFVGLGGFGTSGAGDGLDERVKTIRIAGTEPSILSEVVTAGEAHKGKMKRTPANVDLINKLGGMLPTEVIAMPIMHSNRTIGILYGDNAEHRAPIETMTGLEIFLSQAGYAFGNAVFASERSGRGQEGL
jgi:CheY-like chemotaxis protein